MAQFDLHRTRGRHRAGYPFLLVVQSRSLDHFTTRLVIPLREAMARDEVLPRFVFDGRSFVLVPHEMFAAPAWVLGEVVGSLTESSDLVIRSIDDVITTFYG